MKVRSFKFCSCIYLTSTVLCFIDNHIQSENRKTENRKNQRYSGLYFDLIYFLLYFIFALTTTESRPDPLFPVKSLLSLVVVMVAGALLIVVLLVRRSNGTIDGYQHSNLNMIFFVSICDTICVTNRDTSSDHFNHQARARHLLTHR